jgi:hypothetical protein
MADAQFPNEIHLARAMRERESERKRDARNEQAKKRAPGFIGLSARLPK